MLQGLHLSAYSPLGSPDSASEMGNEDKQKPMEDPAVKEIAKKYNKNPGQVCCLSTWKAISSIVRVALLNWAHARRL